MNESAPGADDPFLDDEGHVRAHIERSFRILRATVVFDRSNGGECI
jgi:hypothetical protein